MKKKLYSVRVESQVTAERLVEATSKNEAYEIANREMKESMDRQLAGAEPHPQIRNMSGAAWALKSWVKIVDEKV